jgi:predicted metal-dependent hydrolase
MDTVASLPPFAVRVSARARRVRLTVTPRDGLVVVVPTGWRGDAKAVVLSKQLWAERALAKVAERRTELLAGPDALMPTTIALPANGRNYAVITLAGSRCSVREVGDILEVRGGADATERLEALKRWLGRASREHLPARVDHLATEHGIAYSRCRVRRARSRWGSCSSAGTISLNRNLMFLPPHLVDALILHELAHRRVFDHSPRFWSELARLDPLAMSHRRELREAGRFVPAWADA